MPHTALRNHLADVTTDTYSETDIDTDASGQVEVTFDGLRRVLGEDPANVSVQAADGYVVNCVSVSGATATIEVHEGIDGTSSGELPAVADGTDVTDIVATAVGE